MTGTPVLNDPADAVETCIACGQPFVAGDMVYSDQDGGCIHAACCGPERECFVNDDGEPLKDGEPIPAPWRWQSAEDVLRAARAC